MASIYSTNIIWINIWAVHVCLYHGIFVDWILDNVYSKPCKMEFMCYKQHINKLLKLKKDIILSFVFQGTFLQSLRHIHGNVILLIRLLQPYCIKNWISNRKTIHNARIESHLSGNSISTNWCKPIHCENMEIARYFKKSMKKLIFW